VAKQDMPCILTHLLLVPLPLHCLVVTPFGLFGSTLMVRSRGRLEIERTRDRSRLTWMLSHYHSGHTDQAERGCIEQGGGSKRYYHVAVSPCPIHLVLSAVSKSRHSCCISNKCTVCRSASITGVGPSRWFGQTHTKWLNRAGSRKASCHTRQGNKFLHAAGNLSRI
jgi:hypothetical protein